MLIPIQLITNLHTVTKVGVYHRLYTDTLYIGFRQQNYSLVV